MTRSRNLLNEEVVGLDIALLISTREHFKRLLEERETQLHVLDFPLADLRDALAERLHLTNNSELVAVLFRVQLPYVADLLVALLVTAAVVVASSRGKIARALSELVRLGCRHARRVHDTAGRRRIVHLLAGYRGAHRA